MDVGWVGVWSADRLRVGRRRCIDRGWDGGGSCSGEDLSDGQPAGHVFALGRVGWRNVSGGDVALEIFERVGAVHLSVARDLIGHTGSDHAVAAALGIDQMKSRTGILHNQIRYERGASPVSIAASRGKSSY